MRVRKLQSDKCVECSGNSREWALGVWGGRGAWRWVCLAARGADHLTFIGLFISLHIVQDIDLVDWAIIWVFVFVCEYLYVGLEKRHADRLWQFLHCATRASIGSTTAVAPPAKCLNPENNSVGRSVYTPSDRSSPMVGALCVVFISVCTMHHASTDHYTATDTPPLLPDRSYKARTIAA